MARRRRIRRDEREAGVRQGAHLVRSARQCAQRQPPRTGLDLSSAVRNGLPTYSTADSLSQAAVLHMQRCYGNRAVQRYLSSLPSRDSRVGQRQLEPERAKGKAAVGTKEVKFKAGVELASDGSVKVDVGPAIDLKKFGVTAGGRYDVSKGWEGAGRLRLGTKKDYLAPEAIVGPDGKLTFKLGHKFTRDILSLSSTLSLGEEKKTMGHTLALKSPFGAKGFDVTASLTYGLVDPRITGAKLAAKYALLGSEKDKSAPYLMLMLKGSYKATGVEPGEKETTVMLLLKGRF